VAKERGEARLGKASVKEAKEARLGKASVKEAEDARLGKASVKEAEEVRVGSEASKEKEANALYLSDHAEEWVKRYRGLRERRSTSSRLLIICIDAIKDSQFRKNTASVFYYGQVKNVRIHLYFSSP